MAKKREKWELTVKAEMVFADVDKSDDQIRCGDLFLVWLRDGRMVLAKNTRDGRLSLVDMAGEIDVNAHLKRKRRKAMLCGRLKGFSNPGFERVRELNSGCDLTPALATIPPNKSARRKI
jgi:hypothetical protein